MAEALPPGFVVGCSGVLRRRAVDARRRRMRGGSCVGESVSHSPAGAQGAKAGSDRS